MALGTGIIPSGALGNQLTYVTRRGFVPKLIVQLYKSTPLLAAFLEGAQMATGGVSSITVPVQGSAFVTMEWSDYSGTFSQPSDLAGISNAEFNLKLAIVGIPFLGMEALVQMDHAIIPLIEARMNDAQNVIRDGLATELYGNTTDTSKILGLLAAIDDGTNVDVYGGITRTVSTYWKSVYVNNSPAIDPTRAKLMEYINQITKKTGEMPTFGVTGFGTWTKAATDFLGLERYNINPQQGFEVARSGFRAIDVSGIPLYADAYCPEGTLFDINTNYLNMYIHEAAAFNFTGFESTLSNYQVGYVGAILTVLELVNAKPATCGQFKGLNFLNI